MITINRQKITRPGQLKLVGLNSDDGLGMTRESYKVVDTIIDMANTVHDEGLAVTWGASATLNHVLVRNCKKLCLIGSGDANPPFKESGKIVTFNNCLFMNFGRRGPEVQSGMVVHMNNCVVMYWGHPDYFDVRAFGAWVHHKGELYLRNCAFFPYTGTPPLGQRLKDKANWLGQSFNYDGLGGILTTRNWKSGWDRAAFRSNDGYLNVKDCYFGGAWHYADEETGSISERYAYEMRDKLISYFAQLELQI